MTVTVAPGETVAPGVSDPLTGEYAPGEPVTGAPGDLSHQGARTNGKDPVISEDVRTGDRSQVSD